MSMKTWCTALISCAVLSLSACHDTSSTSPHGASTADAHAIRVGINAEFAPFESMDENKNIQGFDVDIMNAMAKAGGFKVKFVNLPWDSLFPSLGTGDVDMLDSAITITPERQQSVDFSEPYLSIQQIVLVRHNKHVQSIADLKKLPKIGVAAGQAADLAAQKLLGATSSQIARFDNISLLLKELENGGVDAAISDNAVINFYLKHNKNNDFKIVEIPDFPVEHYGFVVKKGDAEKTKMLNAALKKIHDNGEYAEIEKRYFSK